MDEMKLNLTTKFMKNIVTKLLRKVIVNKIGVKLDVDINNLDLTYKDGKVHIHLNVDSEMNQEEFMKLISKHL